MITVSIGGEERSLADASEHWIADQLNRRQRDSQPVCVIVRINTSGVDVKLATSACGSGGGGGRIPNPLESELIQLWRERKLDGNTFTTGDLIAFLKQLGKKI